MSKVKPRRFTNVTIGTKRKGRGSKVGASPGKWSRKRRKFCRNSGESYLNEKGDFVPPRMLKQKPCTSCKFTKCAEVSEDERKEIFYKFYKRGMTFDDQNVVIAQNVQLLEKKVMKLSNIRFATSAAPSQSSCEQSLLFTKNVFYNLGVNRIKTNDSIMCTFGLRVKGKAAVSK